MQLDDRRRITYALRDRATAVSALAELATWSDTPVTGLVELLHDPPSHKAVLAAIECLKGHEDLIVIDGLLSCLDDQRSSIRTAAIDDLACRSAIEMQPCYRIAIQQALQKILRSDVAATARRRALVAVGNLFAAGKITQQHAAELIAIAASDPYWRVRNQLVDEYRSNHIASSLGQSIIDEVAKQDNPRSRGVAQFLIWLRDRDQGIQSPAAIDFVEHDPSNACFFWDWDPAVLSDRMKRLSREQKRESVDAMLPLCGHDDSRVRKIAIDSVRQFGTVRHFATIAKHMNDPRHHAAGEIHAFLKQLDLDRKTALAELIAADSTTDNVDERADQAWARDHLSSQTDQPVTEESQAAIHLPDNDVELDSMIAEDRIQLGQSVLMLDSDSPLLHRLQSDPHPYVRAAVMTPEIAANILADNSPERSWHVVSKAARIMKTPIWELAGTPWQPAPVPSPLQIEIVLQDPRPHPTSRIEPLATGTLPADICPLGISGHYGLPPEAFAHAMYAGVNFMFWEPNYGTMTDFIGRISKAQRNRIHLVAGTFEADAERVRKDVVRGLRQLKTEQLSLFLVFWVRSWNRITDEVKRTLEDLRTEGKIGQFSLSTHSRPLALDAIRQGWDPVMVRHSAAHRGAEDEIFPRAAEQGTSLITFNNTCYGRLLAEMKSPLEPSDCFRYTLAQPGVKACWTAPATMQQLRENLKAIEELSISQDRIEQLQQVGASVYECDKIYDRLVRRR